MCVLLTECRQVVVCVLLTECRQVDVCVLLTECRQVDVCVLLTECCQVDVCVLLTECRQVVVCVLLTECTLTFQIGVHIRLFIFRKSAALYDTIRVYTFIRFVANPPYTIFIWSMFISSPIL